MFLPCLLSRQGFYSLLIIDELIFYANLAIAPFDTNNKRLLCGVVGVERCVEKYSYKTKLHLPFETPITAKKTPQKYKKLVSLW